MSRDEAASAGSMERLAWERSLAGAAVLAGVMLLAAGCGGGAVEVGLEVGGAEDGRVDGSGWMDGGDHEWMGRGDGDGAGMEALGEGVEIAWDFGGVEAGWDGDAGLGPGAPGAECSKSSDCDSGLCIKTSAGTQCTTTCVDECPFGWKCVGYGGMDVMFVCADPLTTLCMPCFENVDCQGNKDIYLGDKCASYGDAGNFCAAKCDVAECPEGEDCEGPCPEGEDCGTTCPEGYECKDAVDVTGKAGKLCMRVADECTCNQWFADQGAWTECGSSNEWGTCGGMRKCAAEGLTDCDAKVPAAEICNGLDEDCDGVHDEDVGGAGCAITNGFGTCPGLTVCTGGVEKCDGKSAEPETCDGVDNNCNGVTDEGFPDSDVDGKADCIETDKDNDLVPDFLDNCPSTPNPEQKDSDLDTLGDLCDPDDDNDKAGDLVDCAPLDDKVHPGAEEVCDGLDNDCNYVVDEGFPDSDADGWKDCVDPDDDNDGAVDAIDCAALDPASHPGAAEACDGIDNDCDNDVDENLPDLDKDGLADCVDKDADGDGTANDKDNCPLVENELQEDADKDGLGDMCDVDLDGDSIPNEVDNCPTVADTMQAGTEKDTAGDAGDPELDNDYVDNEDDNCPLVYNDGQEDTDNDGKGDACENDSDGDGTADAQDCGPLNAAIHPGAAEVCNGVDDDCDLVVDEGFPDTEGDGLKDCIDADDDGDLDPDDSDCAPKNPAVNEFAFEACDGVDNNCDGVVDEGFGVTACGKGVCAHTVAACAGGAPQACDPLDGISEEVCDGADNDCDGLTDEDQGSSTCGLGACVHTTKNCVAGEVALCDPLAGATVEKCDGIDNDCDGPADEELGTVQCGVGACFHVGPACIGGVPQVCDPTAGAGKEVCDGEDNDCDGAVDEDQGQLACGKGACFHTAPSCVDGVAQVCDPFLGATPEACDSLDNDCDGLADEDLGFASCGLGECFHIVALCFGGQLVPCDPQEGAIAETCDGKDNDCDGPVDEELGTVTCGVGECEHTVAVCVDGAPNDCDPLEGAGAEACDGEDDDCDGIADDGFLDSDGDGSADCVDQDDDADGDLDAVDCAPLDGSIGPSVPEECADGKDNDCDGLSDTDPECLKPNCAELLKSKPGLASGAYVLDPDGAGPKPTFTAWCDMTLDGGGWTLVWKHSYYEVGAWQDNMRFYSSYDKPCVDTSTGWCNVPAKLSIGKTEQATVATYNGTTIYAYKGTLNSKLDSSWEGAILQSPKALVDQCIYNQGVAPEPEVGGHAVPGLTFDKATPGDYVSNCDTDRYANGSDCRWENCQLPGNISPSQYHVQMTVLIYVR